MTGDVALAVDLSGSTATQTVARLTFAGPLTEFGSLSDGNYTLTVFGAQVVGAGRLPAGSDHMTAFHRLYGDATGDRRVDSADSFQLRSTFGRPSNDPLYLAFLDANGDGRMDSADFFQLRARFGATLNP